MVHSLTATIAAYIDYEPNLIGRLACFDAALASLFTPDLLVSTETYDDSSAKRPCSARFAEVIGAPGGDCDGSTGLYAY